MLHVAICKAWTPAKGGAAGSLSGSAPVPATGDRVSRLKAKYDPFFTRQRSTVR